MDKTHSSIRQRLEGSQWASNVEIKIDREDTAPRFEKPLRIPDLSAAGDGHVEAILPLRSPLHKEPRPGNLVTVQKDGTVYLWDLKFDYHRCVSVVHLREAAKNRFLNKDGSYVGIVQLSEEQVVIIKAGSIYTVNINPFVCQSQVELVADLKIIWLGGFESAHTLACAAQWKDEKCSLHTWQLQSSSTAPPTARGNALPTKQAAVFASKHPVLYIVDDAFVAASCDCNIEFFDPAIEGRKVKLPKTLKGHKSKITVLLALPNALLVSGAEDKTLRFWDLRQGTCLAVSSGQQHRTTIVSLIALSADVVASSSMDNTVAVWSTTKLQCLKAMTSHLPYMMRIVPLADGRIASLDAQFRGMVCIIDIGHRLALKVSEESLVSLAAESMVPVLADCLTKFEFDLSDTSLGQSAAVSCGALFQSFGNLFMQSSAAIVLNLSRNQLNKLSPSDWREFGAMLAKSRSALIVNLRENYLTALAAHGTWTDFLQAIANCSAFCDFNMSGNLFSAEQNFQVHAVLAHTLAKGGFRADTGDAEDVLDVPESFADLPPVPVAAAGSGSGGTLLPAVAVPAAAKSLSNGLSFDEFKVMMDQLNAFENEKRYEVSYDSIHIALATASEEQRRRARSEREAILKIGKAYYETFLINFSGVLVAAFGVAGGYLSVSRSSSVTAMTVVAKAVSSLFPGASLVTSLFSSGVTYLDKQHRKAFLAKLSVFGVNVEEGEGLAKDIVLRLVRAHFHANNVLSKERAEADLEKLFLGAVRASPPLQRQADPSVTCDTMFRLVWGSDAYSTDLVPDEPEAVWIERQQLLQAKHYTPELEALRYSIAEKNRNIAELERAYNQDRQAWSARFEEMEARMAKQQERLDAMQVVFAEKLRPSAISHELQEVLNTKANVSEVVTKASLQNMLAAASSGIL
jgi:WD40 repeat protein